MPERKPIKLLFFAWGYSIHAERRIGAFTGDARFDVSVASTYDYALPVKKILFREVFLIKRAEAFRAFRAEQGQPGAPVGPRAFGAKLRLWFGLWLRLVYSHLSRWQWFRALGELSVAIRDYGLLRRQIGKLNPDVIFLQTLMYPSCLSLLLARRYPLIITFWNGDILFWAAYKGWERRLKKRIVATAIRRAQAITVNSSAVQDKVCELGGRREAVHLIRYPGVDRSRFFPGDPQAAQQRIGFAGKRIVLCPRGLGGYLNSEVILQAAARVVAEVPEVLFVFVSGAGAATELDRHQRIAAELGISESVVWAGQVPWVAMPDYYRASEALVSISSQDSLPNCMLEGMACGTPLVLGDIPQLREWVEDGRNAFMVPPQDPEALATRLVSLLSGAVVSVVASQVALNLDLVAKHFDSQVNIEMAKQLVCAVAENNRRRDGV